MTKLSCFYSYTVDRAVDMRWVRILQNMGQHRQGTVKHIKGTKMNGKQGKLVGI